MRNRTKPRIETVKHLTYFVVQTFQVVKGARGRISAEQAMEARNHEHAMALFERYKTIRAGVVAFHRTGDPATGDWEDAVIIARHGQLPTEFDEMTDASDQDFDSWSLGEADIRQD